MTSPRSILPKPTTGSSSFGLTGGALGMSSDQSSRSRKRRRSNVKVACEACRRRKNKCDGLRPKCSVCIGNGARTCSYQVEDGQTRTTAFKQQIGDLKDIIRGLVSATNKDLPMVLASELCANEFDNLKEIAVILRQSTCGLETPRSTDASENMQSLLTDGWPSNQLMEQPDFKHAYQPNDLQTLERRITSVDVKCSRWTKQQGTEKMKNKLSVRSLEKDQRYWFSASARTEHLNLNGIATTPPDIPMHMIAISNSADMRHINTQYTDFINAKKLLIKNGCLVSDVLGPAITVSTDLLSSAPIVSVKSQTVQQWANEIVQGTDSTSIVEKLATMLLIISLARWQIDPTSKHYHEIAECMKPTPVQIMISHPPWIDYIPWPKIRDYLIQSPHYMDEDDVHGLLERHARIHWPIDGGSMIWLNPASNVLVLSDSFESWSRDLNNWSLHSAILGEMPAFADKAWIEDRCDETGF